MKRALSAVLAGLLVFAGCDTRSLSEPEPETRTVRIQGRVTAGGEEGALLPVKEATVRAVSIELDGSTAATGVREVSGAEGEYLLEGELSSRPLLLTAEAEGFESAVLVAASVAPLRQPPPMTPETALEAEIFAAMRAAGVPVTVPDVAAFITAEAVERDEFGTAGLQAAVRAAVEAEEALLRSGFGGGVSSSALERGREVRRLAYAAFGPRVSLAATAQGRRTVEDQFLVEYGRGIRDALVAGGQEVPVRELPATGAAGQAAASALVRTAGARLQRAVIRPAIVTAVSATATAVVDLFRADNADLAAVEAARELVQQRILEGAGLEEAIALYQVAVLEAVGAQVGLPQDRLTAARLAGEPAAEALAAALAEARTAQAFADAFVAYAPAAEADIAAEVRGVRGPFVGRVLALLLALPLALDL